MKSGKDNPKETKYYEFDDIDLQKAVDDGVMGDTISVKVITLWTVILSVVVIILCAIAFNLYKYYKFEQEFTQAVNSQYHEINNLRNNALNSISEKNVIDADAGLYTIPVDSAMTLIIKEYQED